MWTSSTAGGILSRHHIANLSPSLPLVKRKWFATPNSSSITLLTIRRIVYLESGEFCFYIMTMNKHTAIKMAFIVVACLPLLKNIWMTDGNWTQVISFVFCLHAIDDTGTSMSSVTAGVIPTRKEPNND